MPTVADVLRRYGGEYLEQFGTTMPPEAISSSADRPEAWLRPSSR